MMKIQLNLYTTSNKYIDRVVESYIITANDTLQVQRVLLDAKHWINVWLEAGCRITDEIPSIYKNCGNDIDFYRVALENASNMHAEKIDCDYMIEWEY